MLQKNMMRRCPEEQHGRQEQHLQHRQGQVPQGMTHLVGSEYSDTILVTCSWSGVGRRLRLCK